MLSCSKHRTTYAGPSGIREDSQHRDEVDRDDRVGACSISRKMPNVDPFACKKKCDGAYQAHLIKSRQLPLMYQPPILHALTLHPKQQQKRASKGYASQHTPCATIPHRTPLRHVSPNRNSTYNRKLANDTNAANIKHIGGTQRERLFNPLYRGRVCCLR